MNQSYSSDPLPMYDETKSSSSSNTLLRLILGCSILFVVCNCLFCCILPITGTVGLGAVAALFLSNGVSETGSETIRLEREGTGRLEISDASTQVTIKGGTGNDIVIDHKLTVYGWSESAARSALANHEIKIERQPGDTVIISVDKSEAGFSLYDLELTITVPAEMEDLILDVNKAVSIDGVSGNFDISTTSAHIDLSRVDGQFNVITGASGNINFSGNFAPDSQNQFSSDWGDISIRVLGDANIAYSMQTYTNRTSSSSSSRSFSPTVVCPSTVQNLACSGRLGDATSTLSINSDSGDLSLYAN